jgi:hypothetical protein
VSALNVVAVEIDTCRVNITVSHWVQYMLNIGSSGLVERNISPRTAPWRRNQERPYSDAL